MERWHTLDSIKGCGVLAMIISHSLVWWFVYPVFRLEDASVEWFNGVFIATGLFVMALPISAGASLRFMWKRYWDTDTNSINDKNNVLIKLVIRRSLYLFVLATVINGLAWGIDSLFFWNILHFIALSQFVLYLVCRFIGRAGMIWIFFASVVSTFTYALWTPLVGQGVAVDIFFGDLRTAHIWPLLPWISLPIAGFLLADNYIQPWLQKYQILLITLSGIIFSSTILLGLFVIPLTHSFQTIWDIAIQPPTIFVLAAISFVTMMLTMLPKKIPVNTRLNTYLAAMGSAITFIYIAHVIVGFRIVEHVLSNKEDIYWLWIFLGSQIALALLIAWAVNFFMHQRCTLKNTKTNYE